MYLDQASASTSLSHMYLWPALLAQGVAEDDVQTLRGLYAGATTRVQFCETLGDPFPVARGIRQGCLASGSLWAIDFEPILRRMQALLSFGGSALLSVFADDVAVSTDNVTNTANILSALLPRLTSGTTRFSSTRCARRAHGVRWWRSLSSRCAKPGCVERRCAWGATSIATAVMRARTLSSSRLGPRFGRCAPRQAPPHSG